jgi:hypothetical protein
MRSRLVFWNYLSGRPGSRGSTLFGGSNGWTKLRLRAAHEGSRWARLGLLEQQQGRADRAGSARERREWMECRRTGEAHTELMTVVGWADDGQQYGLNWTLDGQQQQ